MKGTYFRWTRGSIGALRADILGDDGFVIADPETGTVRSRLPEKQLSPDEARMYGVRLIEAAALADNGRSIRE